MLSTIRAQVLGFSIYTWPYSVGVADVQEPLFNRVQLGSMGTRREGAKGVFELALAEEFGQCPRRQGDHSDDGMGDSSYDGGDGARDCA